MKPQAIVFLMSVLALSLSVGAQIRVGPQLSDLTGIWNPSVGSGAVYDGVTANGQKIQAEITIIGKEDVNGKTGYWMEIAASDLRLGGDILLKYLVAPGDTGLVATRMIMQMPGQGPMEMDAAMMNRAGRGQSASMTPSDIRSKGEVVGTESITVPGGTFSCQHYRAKDGSDGDYWISDKVGPWGLVKMQEKKGSSDSTVVLTKIVTDAKEHIVGTPTKFDPMQMMRRGQQGQ